MTERKEISGYRSWDVQGIPVYAKPATYDRILAVVAAGALAELLKPMPYSLRSPDHWTELILSGWDALRGNWDRSEAIPSAQAIEDDNRVIRALETLDRAMKGEIVLPGKTSSEAG